MRLVAARVPAAWRDRVLRADFGVHYLGLDRYGELEGLLAALREENITIDELALAETDLEASVPAHHGPREDATDRGPPPLLEVPEA